MTQASVPLLQTSGTTVRFGGVRALNAVDISVPHGSLVGLIGPNGAGKTTLIDALSGFVRPREGRIEFDGTLIDRWGAARRSQHGLRRTFQGVELFNDMTVLENLLVAAKRHRWYNPLVDGILGAQRSEPREHCLEALRLMDIEAFANRLPDELSQGQRRLASVARSFVGDAKLVLLDEPAAGLDSSETVALGAKIQKLRTSGVSILLVDHDTNLVFSICDVIYVLDFGRVIAFGSPNEIRANPEVIRAYLGGSGTARVDGVVRTTELGVL